MDNNHRSLSFVILVASLSVVSALGLIGFLHNVYADNTNISDKVGMNATVTTNANMTAKMNGNMTVNTNGNMTAKITGNSTVTTPPVQKILSPLQQFKSGTPAKTVQCNQGFTLVIKIEDGSPACVSSQIAQILVARGWGTTS